MRKPISTAKTGKKPAGVLRKSLLAGIPKLGLEAESLEADVKAARENQPFVPTKR